MGSGISRLFNELISYVLFLFTFYIPVAKEILSSMRRRLPQA